MRKYFQEPKTDNVYEHIFHAMNGEKDYFLSMCSWELPSLTLQEDCSTPHVPTPISHIHGRKSLCQIYHHYLYLQLYPIWRLSVSLQCRRFTWHKNIFHIYSGPHLDSQLGRWKSLTLNGGVSLRLRPAYILSRGFPLWTWWLSLCNYQFPSLSNVQ